MKIYNLEPIEKSLQKTKVWLDEIKNELEIEDDELTLKMLRLTLIQIRDRLGINEAIQLGDQLPIIIKGFYFEKWKPTNRHKAKHIDDFMAPIYKEFPENTNIDLDYAVKGIFRVLEMHVSGGEIQDVLANFPRDIREFFTEELEI